MDQCLKSLKKFSYFYLMVASLFVSLPLKAHIRIAKLAGFASGIVHGSATEVALIERNSGI